MRKLFSNHKGFIGLGLMSALVVALAVLGALWGFSQSASANGPLVTLVHVEPSGADYTGNPYCPDTIWAAGIPTVHLWHDCNNITSQYHVIRTDDWLASYSAPAWIIENHSGAFATIEGQGRCGNIAQVIGRAGWDAGQCTLKVDDDLDTFVNDGCPKAATDDDTLDTAETTAGRSVNDGCLRVASNDDPTDDSVVNDGCPAVVTAETACNDNVDDDADTVVNDGCPQVGNTRETLAQCIDTESDGSQTGGPNCTGAVDNDGDTTVNDGCPTVGTLAESQAQCIDAESVCTGATDDDGDTLVNDGCPAVGAGEDPDDQQCVVLHSSTPGETRVTLSYKDEAGLIKLAGPVVKEWDSLIDSVILKSGDLVKVKVYYDHDGNPTTALVSKDLWLPKDMNGDTVRDQLDEHLLDKQSVWQDHPVVWDEAVKRIKSAPPVQIIEVVHGEHLVLLNGVWGLFHQPTEGALVLAEILGGRNCTFFTNALGTADYGRTLGAAGDLKTDNLGRVIVYVDTVCEEQAEVHFSVQYPNLPGSIRLGLHEWVGINWTTIEQAKQPQIRWAGEEIILAKRWALPDEWYPNATCGAAGNEVCPYCPLATIGGALYSDRDGDPLDLDDWVVTHHVNYVLLDPGLGALEGGYIDMNGNGALDTLSFMGQSEAIGDIDNWCISKALASSEHPGQQDSEAKLMEDTYFCPRLLASPPDTTAVGAAFVYGEISYSAAERAWVCDYPDFVGPYSNLASLLSSELINKHAFLVWYLKIYEVKLTNVDGERADHNAGTWNQGEGEDTEADTLNVSADTLLRTTVKGWFFGGNLSGRSAVCVDMDGDGNGLEGEEASEPGVPYAVTNEDVGCPDTGDEMLDNGHWVLPDDLPLLAGPDAINTRPNWDVMSEATASKTIAIGPKSALDSHDLPIGTLIVRPWLFGRKTIAPDGKITAADAIMPPLKIRASIADDKDGKVEDGESGYLKQALKGVIYPGTNDYHTIMIPADSEIPAVVNNGGYDWMSWTMPSCTDADADGTCDDVDKCGKPGTALVKNPDQSDVDNDGIGDLCDADADGDTILNDWDGDTVWDDPCTGGVKINCDDNCWLKSNADQADGVPGDGIGTACDKFPAVGGTKATDLDSDGDTVVDGVDNCDTKPNAPPATPTDDQRDSDGDGYGDACDPNPLRPYSQPEPIAYPFWTILYKLEREDLKEAIPALKKAPWYIEFYTDNRGEGMFFANGDFNLFGDRSLDECGTDLVSGAPDCRRDDVVGKSKITVIGDYPYFRKHPAVLSNPVTKTWTWGGFKDVEAIRIDANHTAIIAVLLDRDGFCKYKVGANPTAANAVQFSPSLHPVQGEEIEFVLNSADGAIVDVSPYAEYNKATPHIPLDKANVTKLKDVGIISRDEAVALAEDGRVLDYYDEARGIDEELVDAEDCQAWIVIEHPLGVEPDVSIFLHDPEGVITRHWPRADVTVPLVQNWNDSCYVGEEATVEDAMADIIDNVLAIYRLADDHKTFEQYFPGLCEDVEGLCTITTLNPYDQLFILMKGPDEWVVGPIAAGAPADNKDRQVALAGASDSEPAAWNSVCYAGAYKPTEDAIRGIESGVAIMYQLGSNQAWLRYVPGRPEIPDTLTTLHPYDSVVLLVTTVGGITWTFDP